MDDVWSDAAAWVQALGTIAAVVGAGWMAAGETRAARRREERSRQEAIERERRSMDASKTAALNLALLAFSQIHGLHALLRDETRRNRVTRVSPSRTLTTTEHLLTAFPIQSLGDASAMIAFSYFPGALATAAEIYANLETAIRAASDAERGDVFASYARQMARLDRAMRSRVVDLRNALGLAGEQPVQPSAARKGRSATFDVAPVPASPAA